jgi:hypothetical protein
VLPSYIAWIAASDVPHNALAMEFDESETADIQTLDNLTISPTDNSIYDLQGRKWSNSQLSNGQLPKGLYVVNRKLVIIR